MEKYIGAIITKYDWYDEPMRHSSKEETVLQDVSSTEYSKDSELSEHKMKDTMNMTVNLK